MTSKESDFSYTFLTNLSGRDQVALHDIILHVNKYVRNKQRKKTKGFLPEERYKRRRQEIKGERETRSLS